MLAVLFSFLLIGSDSAATMANTQTASREATESSAAQEPAEAPTKICKRQPVTGQLQGTKRVCMTAEQWKAAQEASARPRR